MNIDTLFDQWGKRNPQWETRFEESIFKRFSDYAIGANQYNESKGKLFGAGYEIYIIAFFLGLYSGQEPRPLIADSKKRKILGQPICFWGNLSDKNILRHSYPEIRKYIFMALIAKTDIDFIALDKGEITSDSVIKSMIKTMEGYANYGLHLIEDKLTDNEDYFYKPTAFLELFLNCCAGYNPPDDNSSEEPESLD